MAPKKQTDGSKATSGYDRPEESIEEQQPVVATELIEEMLATEEALSVIPSSSTTTLEEVLDILREKTKATYVLAKKVDFELKKRGKEAKQELSKAKAKVKALEKKEANLAKRTGLMTLTFNFRNGSVALTVQKNATIGEIRKAFITAWNRRGSQQLAKGVASKLKVFLDTKALHDHPRQCLYTIEGLIDGSILDITIDDADASSAAASIHDEESDDEDIFDLDDEAVDEL